MSRTPATGNNQDRVHFSITSDGLKRPLWSVMIPVYNRITYFRTAIDSVLKQDPGAESMQICVVDNSTTPIDWSRILSKSELNRITVYQQPTSVPGDENWNKCIELSKGQLVHILHDDDWVAQGFYRECEQMYHETPGAGMYAVRSFVVNDTGVIQRVTGNHKMDNTVSFDLATFFPDNPVRTPGVVVQKFAYEKLGGYRGDMMYVLDLEMWLRVVSAFGVRFSSHVLSYYRLSPGNGNDILCRTGDNLLTLHRFYNFATSTYESLKDINWKDHLLQIAFNQETTYRALGEMDAATVARKYWYKHAPLIKRLRRDTRALLKKIPLVSSANRFLRA